MAVYDLEEQEQLDELKAWWAQYGNLVTSVAVAAALAAAAWMGWSGWQNSQSAKAAVVYGGLEQAAGLRNAGQVRKLAGELIENYPRTAYAAMGALISARVQLDTGDSKNAQLQLEWAAANAKDEGLQDLARLRLAAVLLDNKRFDEALKQVANNASPAFAARFADMKGDILAAQGKLDDARTAYKAALAALEKPADNAAGPDQHGAYRNIVQVKLDALSSPTAAPASSPAKSEAK